MACSCTFTSLPLSFDSHTFASLFKLFTRFFQSCLASGSTFRRTNSCSRNSLRRFSNRPRSSVPICRAACTAHPRSPSCRQSLNWHSLASKSMSAKACATPSSASHSCISRNPGVSMSSAPPGKTNSSLLLVVCRPRLSLSRTGCTPCTVCPRSRFTIVDFPTPDDPSNTNVCPGLRNSSSSLNPSPVIALTTQTAVPTATRSISTRFTRTSSQASALFKNDHRLRPGLPALRKISFHSSRIEIAIQCGHEQSHVHIRRNHLFLHFLSRRFAHKLAPSRQDLLDHRGRVFAMKLSRHPIADGRPVCTLVRRKPQLPARFRPAFAELSRDAPEFPLLRNHARRSCILPIPTAPKRFKVRIPSPTCKRSSNGHG